MAPNVDNRFVETVLRLRDLSRQKITLFKAPSQGQSSVFGVSDTEICVTVFYSSRYYEIIMCDPSLLWK